MKRITIGSNLPAMTKAQVLLDDNWTASHVQPQETRSDVMTLYKQNGGLEVFAIDVIYQPAYQLIFCFKQPALQTILPATPVSDFTTIFSVEKPWLIYLHGKEFNNRPPAIAAQVQFSEYWITNHCVLQLYHIPRVFL